MLVNRHNLNDLFVAWNAAYMEGFGAYTADDLSPILMRTTVNTKEAHYAWLGAFPGLRKWLGDRVVQQLKAHDYRIKNEPFESTVEVDSDDITYDQYGIYRPLMVEMGRAAAAHPFTLSFDLLKAGFTTECYDGQFFFDTDHAVGRDNPQSVSNFGGGAGDPWFLVDGSRAIKPLIFQEAKKPTFVAINRPEDESVFNTRKFKYGVDSRCNVGFGLWQLAYASQQTLDPTNFNAAFAAMSEFKNDEGRPLGVRPTHLYCKPSQRAAAMDIVKEFGNSGESNVNRNLVKVVDTPWLA